MFRLATGLMTVGLALCGVFTMNGRLDAAQDKETAPSFEVHYDLVDLGLKMLNPETNAPDREKYLSEYLKHPMMQVAFRRYGSTDRPTESRVNPELYADFIRKLWTNDISAITHPRMKFILDHYKWGRGHLGELKSDNATIKSSLPSWLADAKKKIPWGTVAVEVAPKPHHIVFLFDPGGSFPWVTDEADARYIYVDILQMRGPTDKERAHDIDPDAFGGLLVHELFHLFQHDQNKAQDAPNIFSRFAVGEGSAMLIGNNAPDSHGDKYWQSEPTRLKGAYLGEWTARAQNNPRRIEDLIGKLTKWKSDPPKGSDLQGIMTSENWVASASNGLYFGDLYRVGAEMLLAIRKNLGNQAFYEVIADSSKLVEVWKKAVKAKDVPTARANPATQTVPYKYVGGHLLRIPVTINGTISTSFILDTGIGLNLISKTLCAKIGCITEGTYTGKRMSGQELSIPLSKVASIAFGSKKREQVPVGVFDLTDDSPDFAGVDGFLSLQYLESFPFTFDRNASVIVIEGDSSLNERLKTGIAVPISIKRDASTTGISFVMALPEGSSAKMEVDTGSDSLILDTRFMAGLGIKENHPDTKKVDGKDETGHIFTRYFSDFHGPIHPAGAPKIAQLDVRAMFQKIIYDGLVGDSFLKKFTVTFDLPHSRMIFAPL